MNMWLMSVTEEVFHPERSPLKAVALWNMYLMSFTEDRSGVSVALYTMFVAPSKARSILVHDIYPHCHMAVSIFALFESSPRRMRPKSPDMDTLYEPAVAYVWVASPV